jgi:hypothetical protein
MEHLRRGRIAAEEAIDTEACALPELNIWNCGGSDMCS